MIFLGKAFVVDEAWVIMAGCHIVRAAVFPIKTFIIALALVLSFWRECFTASIPFLVRIPWTYIGQENFQMKEYDFQIGVSTTLALPNRDKIIYESHKMRPESNELKQCDLSCTDLSYSCTRRYSAVQPDQSVASELFAIFAKVTLNWQNWCFFVPGVYRDTRRMKSFQ